MGDRAHWPHYSTGHAPAILHDAGARSGSFLSVCSLWYKLHVIHYWSMIIINLQINNLDNPKLSYAPLVFVSFSNDTTALPVNLRHTVFN